MERIEFLFFNGANENTKELIQQSWLDYNTISLIFGHPVGDSLLIGLLEENGVIVDGKSLDSSNVILIDHSKCSEEDSENSVMMTMEGLEHIYKDLYIIVESERKEKKEEFYV